jgi:hypothetical protein
LHAGSIPARASSIPVLAGARALAKGRASAALAQLVEHLIRNEGVTGSSPVSGTIHPMQKHPKSIDKNGGILPFSDRASARMSEQISLNPIKNGDR